MSQTMTVSRRLADAIADTITLLDLGHIRELIVDEIAYLLSEPVGWYLRYPNWPSGLGSGGIPVECSLAITGNSSATIRLVVDSTDHRQGFAANWERYLEYARYVTGAPSEQLWRLFSAHLDGIPSGFRSRALHGLAYGPLEEKRSSIYFTTSWLSNSQLRGRFSEYFGALDATVQRYGGIHPARISGMSYDYATPGEWTRVKSYAWLRQTDTPAVDLHAVLANYPDLMPAARVYNDFTKKNDDFALLLQLSLKRGDEFCRQKGLYFCPAWGWNKQDGFHGLLSWLCTKFETNLWQLYVLLEVFAAYNIRLIPAFVACGRENQEPSFTFYFSPSLQPGIGNEHQCRGQTYHAQKKTDGAAPSIGVPSGKLKIVEEMYARALGFLLASKQADGQWEDFALPHGRSDEWVTAYITSILAQEQHLHNELRPAVSWLQNRFRPGRGWSIGENASVDADSSSLALLALQRTSTPLPENVRQLLLRYRLARGGYCTYTDRDVDHENGLGAIEITANVLLAYLVTGTGEIADISEAVTNLAMQQRDEGGWNAFWWKDDLFATYRVLEAFTIFVRRARSDNNMPSEIIQSAANAVRHARPGISAQAVPAVPFALGLWLRCWLAADGNLDYPSLGRVLHHLQSEQENDGRWLSAPIRRIAKSKLLRPWARSDSGKLYLDPGCLITTCTIVDGLRALKQALGEANGQPNTGF